MRVPSPPPRRLSRSSIDLRDLEQHHEKVSQSDSVSSVYPLDNYLRYSGSEPLHNQYQKKPQSERDLNEKSSNYTKVGKPNNFFQPFLAKANLIRHYGSERKSKESVSNKDKDNQAKTSYNNNLNNQTVSVCSNNNGNNCRYSDNFINNFKHVKRQFSAASESDFLAMRNNGLSNIHGNINTSQPLNSIENKHRLKQTKHNLMYALSDSDFLSWNISSSEYSKIINININPGKSKGDNNEAIFNKSDIFKIIVGKSSSSLSTLTGDKAEKQNFKLEKPDILSGLTDVDDKKYNYIDDEISENVEDDEIRVDSLVGKNIANIDSIIDAALSLSCNDFVDVLSPQLLQGDENLLNTSKSSDAVLIKSMFMLVAST